MDLLGDFEPLSAGAVGGADEHHVLGDDIHGNRDHLANHGGAEAAGERPDDRAVDVELRRHEMSNALVRADVKDPGEDLPGR